MNNDDPFQLNLQVALSYLAIHLGCLGVFWSGEVWLGMTICVVTFFVRMFALAAVYHRYFSHRAYETSRTMQFLLALVGTLTMQRGPLWWAAIHRRHHQYSDSPHDIHSPHYQGFIYSYSGWFLNKRNKSTNFSIVYDFAKYPELRILDDWRGYSIPVALYGLVLYLCFGWTGFFWGFCVSTVCLLHMTHWIQSISHCWGGYRRFSTQDQSRNHWFIGLISLGEYHNNHHYCSFSARQGFTWWEVDITYYLLRFMEVIGLIWNLRDFSLPLHHDKDDFRLKELRDAQE